MSTSTKPTIVENIQVLQVGKYGVRVDEKTWFGVNEPLTPSNFAPNEGYKVSVTVSKTGKKYINEILGKEVSDATKAAAPAQGVADAVKDAETALAKAKADAEAKVKEAASLAAAAGTPPATHKNPTRAGFGQPMTDYDLKIQRVINHSSCWNAACSAASALSQYCTNSTELAAEITRLAETGLKFTDR